MLNYFHYHPGLATGSRERTDQRVSWSTPLAVAPFVLPVMLFPGMEEAKLWREGLFADSEEGIWSTGRYSSVNVDATFILRGSSSWGFRGHLNTKTSANFKQPLSFQFSPPLLKSQFMDGLGISHVCLQAALQPFCQVLLCRYLEVVGLSPGDLCHFLTKGNLFFTIELRLEFMRDVESSLSP